MFNNKLSIKTGLMFSELEHQSTQQTWHQMFDGGNRVPDKRSGSAGVATSPPQDARPAWLGVRRVIQEASNGMMPQGGQSRGVRSFLVLGIKNHQITCFVGLDVQHQTSIKGHQKHQIELFCCGWMFFAYVRERFDAMV